MSEKNSEVTASKRVVVCINVKSHKTKSGLELSGTDNKPDLGQVIAFGTGKKPVEFEIGDIIVFRKYTDNKIYLGSEEYNFVQFKDILGKVNPK